MNNQLAHVGYICIHCKTEKKYYQLYFSTKGPTTKYCWKCCKITRHKQVLPKEEYPDQYERPSLFPE